MNDALKSTDFQFPFKFEKYSGKVRDVYNLMEECLVIVASDRISAFDVILPEAIPFKGQVLNQTAAYFLEATKDIVRNHVISIPDPNVTIALKAKSIPVEVVVRGYLAGHASRTYESGLRELCGVKFPEGLKENDRLPEPVITPSTKSAIGHDEDISVNEIIKSGLLDADEWAEISHYALALFARGTQMAAERGLILADTKYEFGWYDDRIILIDEIHTPDSSRYFYLDGFDERQKKGEAQKQLSKEFVRIWLMQNGFQGKEGQKVPLMPAEFVNEISTRYIELYDSVTGKKFVRAETGNISQRIMNNLENPLKSMGFRF